MSIYAITAKQEIQLNTWNGSGNVRCDRREIGVGKGAWYRAVKLIQKEEGLNMKLSRRWYGPVAFYSLRYEGPDARALYDVL